MQTTLVTTGVFAVAMALNSSLAFGEDALNRTHTNVGKEGNQAIVGKLVSLCDYLEKGDQSTTSSSSSSQKTSPFEAKQPGSPAGQSGGLGGARSESLTGVRDQTDAQGSKVTPGQTTTSFQSTSRDSSKEQTLVLIAQHGATLSSQPSSVGSTSPTPNQPAGRQSGSEQRSGLVTGASDSAGQAYILVFGDDASSQSAYLKAKGMITDGSSNWATSKAETNDRLPVRGEDNARSDASRNVTRTQPGAEAGATGRTGQRDPAGMGSKAGSQVRVTGKLVSRGGIQAIQVSEISLASMMSDPATKSPTSADRNRQNPNNPNSPTSPNSDKKTD